MSALSSLIGPVTQLLDRIIPDRTARDRAKLALLRLEGEQQLETVGAGMAAILSESGSRDPWVSRARPTFLYVIYFLLLWAIPMSLVAAIWPAAAARMSAGMGAYLAAIPEPLYALFATGYLGYTAARTWGKIRGVE